MKANSTFSTFRIGGFEPVGSNWIYINNSKQASFLNQQFPNAAEHLVGSVWCTSEHEVHMFDFTQLVKLTHLFLFFFGSLYFCMTQRHRGNRAIMLWLHGLYSMVDPVDCWSQSANGIWQTECPLINLLTLMHHTTILYRKWYFLYS